jgi:undecaprenyl-diphosphatase
MKAIAPSGLFLPSDPAEAVSWGRRLLLLLLVGILGAVSLLIHILMPPDWNIAVTRAVQAVRFPGLSELMRHISGFGNASKMVFVTAIALVACNRSREAFWLVFSGVGGWLLAMQLKLLFASARPSADLVTVFHQWDTASFPSGHVVFYVCFFGFIFFLARERLTADSWLPRIVMFVAAALILLVGISRVYVGEHWVSDLPGSYLLGVLWLTLSVKLYVASERSGMPRYKWFLPDRVTER